MVGKWQAHLQQSYQEQDRCARDISPTYIHGSGNTSGPVQPQIKPRTALILYGSETGNAQDVADEIGDLTARLHFDTTVLDFDSVSLRDIVKPTVLIFAISTTGQGEFPQNARRFWRTLLSSGLKVGVLRKVKFASFGLGDSSYPRFNVAHRMLHGRLVHLGAQAFCDRGEGNEQHPEGHSATLRTWTVALKEKLLEVFPLEEGVLPIADDVFIEPKWKFQGALTTGNGNGDQSNGVSSLGTQSGPSHLKELSNRTSPSTDLLPVKTSYTAEILGNDRITAPDHFQDVRVLDLRLQQPYSYNPGAVAVVYPKNFPQDVQEFIDLMSWQDVADQPINLIRTAEDTPGTPPSPSPLRHLELSSINLTIRWLLENVLDIMSIPRRSFFASLAHFAGTATEDEAYQKERLLELANPELIDELWDYTTRPKRTIVEVMMDFTTIKIPWQYVLNVLPMMKGRQFSIASGGKLKVDDEGHTKVELLVAIADPPSPIIKWRRRHGVCTRYITTLEAGQRINIGLQQGYLDVKPSEVETPVVMIGPGTGLAPMRAMTWQRLAWAQELGVRQDGRKLEDDILVFGCRSEEADFFFKHEWDQLARDERLNVLAAFSRSKATPRKYVQDRIRDEGEAIHRALVENNGKVYVSGSSGSMPKGVREALVDVLVQYGREGMAREEAEGYLDSMEKAGRYKQETW
ncbi:riboflavin synthase domain-like protein [Hortaea werneckii]|nr:riboflavin synthase domain-like protein [Hortaea werneckii]KAI7626781.1 riboflavin synthase domain-like protein [Hortaea werneckii]KAI7637842.1 riboflavin synthase domain-like protein [Hortaea werneckii]KAI7683457.1 riboflavin synthase domain-like protein [Hortaea werneckii]KAI7723683.1 riboflavin synthase domain-like protein [Hortaea werneckii]